MKKIITLLACIIQTAVYAQVDSSLFKRVAAKDTSVQLNVDAMYSRPFLSIGKTPVAVGGYLEANTNYAVTDGVSEGFSFQMRRMTIFLSSAIGKRIRFLSEIEFEDGTKEINIEFAAVDFEFHPMFNLRGGIIMNPIGAFNQNHDGPKWEFIERPISATTIIPSTWSNVGFGLWGKYSKDKWAFAYEAYLSNGFDDQIINNSLNRTSLPASKQNPDRFEESSNGMPLTTLKTALGHRKYGEVGISWMGGVYNTFQEDGLVIDSKRRVDLVAIDFNTTLPVKTYVRGEWVWAFIDVPSTYSQQYGNKQHGGFVDIVQPVLKRTMLGFEKAVLNTCVRLEYSDYNVGTFNETGQNIGDNIYAVVPGISFRPYPQTVIRANYRYSWTRDLLNNPPSKTAAYQFGFSTYF
ncbi:MAG: hypothetical protein ACTHJT_08590 [Cytophaga sp.]|uniref:hypothetical protein n=1 Tax=Cytophaga sp. TaxID=29535 RepID=UPI003F8051AD